MPLYEYHCNKCDATFEQLQKMDAEELRVHDSCGGELQKLLSLSGLRFNGPGFYINDYGSHRITTKHLPRPTRQAM